MNRLPASVAWWCFEQWFEPLEFIVAARDAQYDGIEFVPDAFWPHVVDAGLSIAAIGGHASLTDGLNVAANHDRIEREILSNIERAERWSIPHLICFSGNRNGVDDISGAEISARGLERVARAAEQANVTLVLELLNSKIDHPDYQCDHSEWGVRVCEWVGSTHVKLLYDVYHMQIMEGDISRTFQRNHAFIGHVHVAGNPGRHEPDVTQELNYPAIYDSIAATGYNGYIGMEFIPASDPRQALASAVEQLAGARAVSQ